MRMVLFINLVEAIQVLNVVIICNDKNSCIYLFSLLYCRLHEIIYPFYLLHCLHIGSAQNVFVY